MPKRNFLAYLMVLILALQENYKVKALNNPPPSAARLDVHRRGARVNIDKPH